MSSIFVVLATKCWVFYYYLHEFYFYFYVVVLQEFISTLMKMLVPERALVLKLMLLLLVLARVRMILPLVRGRVVA